MAVYGIKASFRPVQVENDPQFLRSFVFSFFYQPFGWKSISLVYNTEIGKRLGGRRLYFLPSFLIKSLAYSGKIPVGLKVFFVTHTCARRFTYVGSPVDNCGLQGLRMWDGKYSQTVTQIEGYEDTFLTFVFFILQGCSSKAERVVCATKHKRSRTEGVPECRRKMKAS